VLFRWLAEEPEIKVLITNEITAGPYTSETRLPQVILSFLSDVVQKALETYLDQQGHVCPGFSAWAEEYNLIKGERNDRKAVAVEDKRAIIQYAICLKLLAAPAQDQKLNKLPWWQKTIIQWVKSGWKVTDRRTGRVVRLNAVLLNALLGVHRLSRRGRLRGALRQGLVHHVIKGCFAKQAVFNEQRRLKWREDCKIAVVRCPGGEKPVETLFSPLTNNVTCSLCWATLPAKDHVIQALRYDLLGSVIQPTESEWQEQLRNVTNSTYPVYAELRFARCPGDREMKRALAEWVIRHVAATPLPDQRLVVLQALKEIAKQAAGNNKKSMAVDPNKVKVVNRRTRSFFEMSGLA
jgi:hypothetical protein